MRRGISNVGARVAVAAAIAAMLLLPSAAHADEPAPFPYGELAALAAAEAPVRVVARAPTVVRLRPALDWPALAEVNAGNALVANAITPGRDPWLRVEWGAGETSRRGWMRLADLAAPPAGLSRLPIESAEPILADGPYWGVDIHAWPNGPSTGYGLLNGPWPVAGRSVDGEWVAVQARGLTPLVVWLRSELLELSDPNLRAADLPVFVGRETVLLPLGKPAEQTERAARTLRPARGWVWSPEGVVRAWGDGEVWTYDPDARDLELEEAVAANGLASPDGRWLAITDCLDGERSCRNAFGLQYFTPTADLVLVSLSGAEPVVFFDVFGRIGTQREGEIMHGWGWPGRWSPDSQMLLVPSFHRGEGEPNASWSGANWTALTVDGGEHRVSISWLEPLPNKHGYICNPYGWSAGANRTLIFTGLCDGKAHVFSLDGALLRSEEPNSLEGIVGGESLGESLGEDVQVDWSPDRSMAALVSERGDAVWLYRASDQSLSRLDGEEPRSDNLPWESATWGSHWSPDSRMLLLSERYGGSCGLYFYEAFLLVDASSGATREVVSGDAVDRVCGTTVEWSADGEWWWIEVFTGKGTWLNEDAQVYGRDGLSAPHGYSRQLRIYDRNGSLAHVFRAELGQWEAGSTHRAGWSPDGSWLAIGARDASVSCRCGH